MRIIVMDVQSTIRQRKSNLNNSRLPTVTDTVGQITVKGVRIIIYYEQKYKIQIDYYMVNKITYTSKTNLKTIKQRLIIHCF